MSSVCTVTYGILVRHFTFEQDVFKTLEIEGQQFTVNVQYRTVRYHGWIGNKTIRYTYVHYSAQVYYSMH
jgi:hypothetical protein